MIDDNKKSATTRARDQRQNKITSTDSVAHNPFYNDLDEVEKHFVRKRKYLESELNRSGLLPSAYQQLVAEIGAYNDAIFRVEQVLIKMLGVQENEEERAHGE
jgi:hypothetical protein